MMFQSRDSKWLHQYGNAEKYQWKKTQFDGRSAFSRPLGLVEYSFDGDGRFYEGRADMTDLIEVKVNSTLDSSQFRERMLLVWACLRCRHALLRARSVQDESSDNDHFAPLGMYFVVDCLDNVQQAIETARPHVVFLEDHFPSVDPLDFYHHVQNSTRVIDPDVALSKLYVFPIEKTNGVSTLRLFLNGAHLIWDGLTSHAWNRDFLTLLNDPPSLLTQKILSSLPVPILPLPQEALYPSIPGSSARKKWFWLLVRILRHVRRPLRAGFPNPLLRRGPKPQVTPLPPTYHPILSYSNLPVFNTRTFTTCIPTKFASRLRNLCRAARTSMGAGCFALVAVVMMEFHEKLHPFEDPYSRPDYIAGFPLDARAFVQKEGVDKPENLMLAFCDGISLPFLPSHLDLAGRLRLLAKRAHVQLAAYQKSRRELSEEQVKRNCLTSRGAGLVLANQYLSSFERVASVTPEELRSKIDTQGSYPIRRNPTLSTNGVSSLGRRDVILRRGEHKLDDPEKDFAADFVDMKVAVRAREGEFLVAVGTAEEGLFVSCSADITTLDPDMIEQWRKRIEHVLDDLENDEKAKL